MAQGGSTQRRPISLQEDGDPMVSLSSSAPNEESEILPAQVYTDPTESLPTMATTLLPNQAPEFPIQMYTDPTELPPMSAPYQAPELPIQNLSPTPVPHQVPEIPPVQACTDITESPPTSVPNQVPDYSLVSQGLEELPSTPEPNSFADAARWSSRIAERIRNVTELRWGNSHLRDGIPKSDGGGGGHRQG